MLGVGVVFLMRSNDPYSFPITLPSFLTTSSLHVTHRHVRNSRVMV